MTILSADYTTGTRITDKAGHYYSISEARQMYSNGEVEAGNGGFYMLVKANFNPDIARDLMKGWES